MIRKLRPSLARNCDLHHYCNPICVLIAHNAFISMLMLRRALRFPSKCPYHLVCYGTTASLFSSSSDADGHRWFADRPLWGRVIRCLTLSQKSGSFDLNRVLTSHDTVLAPDTQHQILKYLQYTVLSQSAWLL